MDLPIPGSPPIKITPPGTKPPPRTRSNSEIFVFLFGIESALTSSNFVSSLVFDNAANLEGVFDSIVVSSSEFQTKQCGHCPCHLDEVPPHSLH